MLRRCAGIVPGGTPEQLLRHTKARTKRAYPADGEWPADGWTGKDNEIR